MAYGLQLYSHFRFNEKSPTLPTIPNPQAMRSTLFFLLVGILFASCKTNEPTDLIEGYDVDFDPQVDKRTFYVCTQTLDTMMSTFQGFSDNNESFVRTEFHREGSLYSKRKYKVTPGKKLLIEEEYFQDPYGGQLDVGAKSDIREQSRFEEDLKYSGARYKASVTYPGDNVQKAINEEWYEKDTVFQWGDQILPAIKFKGYDRYSYFPKYLPFASTVQEYDSYTILAKGLGLVAWGYRERGGVYEEDVVLVKVEKGVFDKPGTGSRQD